MKILSIEGNFGKLNNKKINFKHDFTLITLNNEGGKTTWSTFIKTMLYGLDKSKRDKIDELSEKNKYFPHMGGNMWGRIRILYNNRIIVITRNTDKKGLMQNFSAIYEDTGSNCEFLSDKDCGKTLTGLSENAFADCVFIDGANLQVKSSELEDIMLSLLNTGDSSGAYNKACLTLKEKKNSLRSRNRTGLLVQAENQMNELGELLSTHDELDISLTEYTEHLNSTIISLDETTKTYELAKIAYDEDVIRARAEIEIRLDYAEERLRASELIAQNEITFKEAQDALFSYDGALKEERITREKLPYIEEWYEDELNNIYQKASENEEIRRLESKLSIKWWALILAAFLAFCSVFNLYAPINVGNLTPYTTYILAFFSVVCIIITFHDSAKKDGTPIYDIEGHKKALLIKREELEFDHRRAVEITSECYDTVIKLCQQLDSNCSDIEDCRKLLFETERALSELYNLRLETEKLRARSKTIKQGLSETDKRLLNLNSLKTKIDDLTLTKTSLTNEISSLNGKKSTLITRDKLTTTMQVLSRKHQRLSNEYDAVLLCESALSSAYEALSQKLSPEINKLCAQYLSQLTSGKYDTVYIKHGFSGEAGNSQISTPMLSNLKLSTGAKDQLYLALRLATAKLLIPKTSNIPLILDDPFMSFDNERTYNALALLQELSKERQIILFSARNIKEVH